jgi:hypothetical protein
MDCHLLVRRGRVELASGARAGGRTRPRQQQQHESGELVPFLRLCLTAAVERQPCAWAAEGRHRHAASKIAEMLGHA